MTAMKHLLRRSEPAPTSLFTILPRLTLTYSFKPRPQRTFDSDQLTVATSTGNWHQVPRHSTKLRRRKTTSKTIRYPDDAKRNKKKNPISYLARNHLVSKKTPYMAVLSPRQRSSVIMGETKQKMHMQEAGSKLDMEGKV